MPLQKDSMETFIASLTLGTDTNSTLRHPHPYPHPRTAPPTNYLKQPFDVSPFTMITHPPYVLPLLISFALSSLLLFPPTKVPNCCHVCWRIDVFGILWSYDLHSKIKRKGNIQVRATRGKRKKGKVRGRSERKGRTERKGEKGKEREGRRRRRRKRRDGSPVLTTLNTTIATGPSMKMTNPQIKTKRQQGYVLLLLFSSLLFSVLMEEMRKKEEVSKRKKRCRGETLFSEPFLFPLFLSPSLSLSICSLSISSNHTTQTENHVALYFPDIM